MKTPTLCMAFGLLLAGRSAASEATEIPARRIAIVVGANHAPAGRTELRFSYRDADALAGALRDVGRFAPENVHVLRDPTPAVVLAAIDGALADLRGTRGQGLLLFYYSGHADDHALYPNGEPLELSKLKAGLDDPAATVRIGILDSCSGGGWTQAKGFTADRPFEVRVPLQLTSEGSALIASSSGIESAHESNDLQGSFFTHHFVAGLRGAAARSGASQVTLQEAFAYAQERTIRDTAEQAETPQHPSFDIHLRGRQDLTLAQLDQSPSVLEVDETEGPLQLVQLENGLVVLELPSGKRELKLALPPGAYLVRRRVGNQTFARAISVENGRAISVEEASLTLVGSSLLTSKGLAVEDASLNRHATILSSAIAAGSLAFASLTTGIVLLLDAQSRFGIDQQLLQLGAQPTNSVNNTAQNEQTAAYVLIPIGAAAAVATGVLFYLLPADVRPPSGLSAGLTPTGLSLAGSF